MNCSHQARANAQTRENRKGNNYDARERVSL